MTTETAVAATGARTSTAAPRTLAVVRIALGWVFLWAFLDKTFGLGFGTPAEGAWLEGGSPTSGFLSSREGTFGDLFQGMAGQPWADWMFMGALAGLGTALILGIGLRVAAIGGPVLMIIMWMSMLPLEENPFFDTHLFYACSLVALAFTKAGDTWGLGRPWSRTALVQRIPVLR